MSEIYEGNSMTVNNINKSKAKINLRGGSKQETREGYNLANLDADSFTKNGVTVTNNGDGSWTFNGTSSSYGDLVLTKNVLLSNKIYQFEDATYLFKTIVVSGSFSNPDKVTVQTSAMGQDNGVDNFGTLYNKLSDGVFVNIFNEKSTSHLSRFELYCGPNVTFNNYTIKILFAKTDNEELEWEQYGASPSPEFPSKIENVENDVKITVTNGLEKTDTNYKEQTITFPLEPGQKLYEGSYLAQDGIHNTRKQITLDGTENWVKYGSFKTGYCYYVDNLIKGYTDNSNHYGIGMCTHFIWANSDDIFPSVRCQFDNGNRLYVGLTEDLSLEDFKALIKAKYDEGTPIMIEYQMQKEATTLYTQKQNNIFYDLQNILLYDGINYISIDDKLESMSVEVSKIIEDYETYISSNGFFINSQNDIHYLIDFSESELPCMAETTETTVKAAGRNGDIVLSTTYDANTFNIVCYTEDNLTQEEKVKEEMKLKKLLNSIKNKTIPLAFEKDDKFYKVKYSGAFSSTNFPKHLKFSIPLKTSEAYGKDLIKKVIFGNGEETSDTFEDVGAIFTIKGPANSPIISLNDYSIEYDNPLLEGDKLVINSSNSTITHINSDGVETNAMRYYNHQFPKIENGKNVLKVLSGVNEENVSVEWYDYKF